MSKPNKVKGKVSSSPREDEFWISFGQSLISGTIDVLDERAKWMVITTASLEAADLAITLILSKVTLFTVSPQFFFAFSTLFFIISLFPRRYQVNLGFPDETRDIYVNILNEKHRWHKIGFIFFFFGLFFVALSSLFPVPE